MPGLQQGAGRWAEVPLSDVQTAGDQAEQVEPGCGGYKGDLPGVCGSVGESGELITMLLTELQIKLMARELAKRKSYQLLYTMLLDCTLPGLSQTLKTNNIFDAGLIYWLESTLHEVQDKLLIEEGTCSESVTNQQ